MRLGSPFIQFCITEFSFADIVCISNNIFGCRTHVSQLRDKCVALKSSECAISSFHFDSIFDCVECLKLERRLVPNQSDASSCTFKLKMKQIVRPLIPLVCARVKKDAIWKLLTGEFVELL